MRPTHFYVFSDAEAALLESWDPDRDPTQFASGNGHNVYELYARLRDKGYPVTAGRIVPREAKLVVAFAPFFESTNPFSSTNELLWGSAAARTLMIRSDWKLNDSVKFRPDAVIVPNRAAYWAKRYGKRAHYLPALPQRGLIPRRAGRTGLDVAVLKANPENIPGYLEQSDSLDRLQALGVEVVVDAPSTTNGSDQNWHDFREADVALCLRSAAEADDDVRKPPTKLINAWSTGVVPLVAPEMAYVDLIEEGEDAFVVSSFDEILAVVLRLKSSAGVWESVQERVALRTEQYSQDHVLEMWVHLLTAESSRCKSWGRSWLQRSQVVADVARRRLRSKLGQ